MYDYFWMNSIAYKSFKENLKGAREMTRRLRVLIAFPEDPGSTLSTHKAVHNSL